MPPLLKTEASNRPRGNQDTVPSLPERVGALKVALAESGFDTQRTWCSALRLLVEARNQGGVFDDILEHSTLASCEPVAFPGLNPLEDLDVATLSALYEFVLASEDMVSKRKRGQFFTPNDISTFMARRANDFAPGVWLDPCCGVGNLSHALVATQEDPEDFLINCLICSDIDDLALFTARVLKSLSFQNKVPYLFTALEDNFRRGDFLQDSLLDSYPFRERYDFVLMNPPYAQAKDEAGVFHSAPSRDLFAFFLEKAAATSKGFVAITPQVFTNGKRHAQLRSLLLDHSSKLDIYCFDNVPDTVFRGFKYGSENSNQVNSTRAAITVSQKTPKNNGLRSKSVAITPLLRWRAAERSRLLDEADSFLTSPPGISPSLFPKVNPGLEVLYGRMLEEPVAVRDLLSTGEEGPSLTVPTTPRYFISAVQRTLNRSSQRHLFFNDEESCSRAYLVLNSSLAYFWWRVRDGGMTLSLETLLSLPIPTTIDCSSEEARRLIGRLQESEDRNLVTKLNAGKVNENVKHPLDLIDEVNRFVAINHRDALLHLHSNSTLSDPR